MKRFLLLAVTPLLIPPAMFYVCGLTSGLGPVEAALSMVEQYGSKKFNLWMITVLGFIPTALLVAILGVHPSRKKNLPLYNHLTWGGYIPLLLLLIFPHLEFWPKYLPEKQFMGFPHGLEFVIASLFFAPVAILIGLFAGWVIHKLTTK